MRRIDIGRLLAAAIAASLAAAAPAGAAAPPPNEALIGELDALRQESVGIARTAQQHERALAVLGHLIALTDREAAARQRGLDDSRGQQSELLGALERLARNPPEAFALAPEGPVDRIRTGLLMAAAIPALQTEARALTAEIGRVAQLHGESTQDKDEAATRRDALARNHQLLAQLRARRIDITGQLVKDDAASDTRLRGLADHAADPAALIKQADAEAARREKAMAHAPGGKRGAAAGDPTQPKSLRPFDPARPELLLPATGTIARHFAAPDESGQPAQQLEIAAPAGGEVVAPFDGKVVYAGPYRDYGLILIIRHGGLYHSLLAGFGRVDARPGEWVVAGEPVGVMPEAATNRSSISLTFELRRDFRAIDPEPSLAPGGDDAGMSSSVEQNRVRE